MPTISTLIVPYELGRLREGVGCGPEHLLEQGAAAALGSSGATVNTRLIELSDRFNVTGSGEEDSVFELIRQVADGVRAARQDGAFPVVLSGSCFSTVGAVAGLDEPALGVVWFDAHADFNEPTTTISGYIDGMGVAILTGSAWQGLLATVPGARPVAESRVVLAGARDLDPPEETRLGASQIVHFTADQLRSPDAVLDAVHRIHPEITGLYIHLDLDVLDSSVATVNVYHSANGPDADQVDALVAALLETFPVHAIYLGTYDPAFDPENRVPPIALRILRTIAAGL
jgi:arginase